MENKKNNNLISGLIMIIIGILFLIFQGKILGVLFTILGVLLIAFGIIDIINNNPAVGLVKIIIGILIIVFGWTVIKICLYIVAVLLIIYGVLGLISLLRYKARGTSPLITILLYLSPILDIACGVLLFVNQIVAINYVFIFFGILLLIDGLILILTPANK